MVSTRYFREIFKVSPIPSLLIKAKAPHFEMVEPNPAFCKTMGKSEDEIIGKKVFEVFPTNPENGYSDGVETLRSSFEKVILTKKEDVMPRLRYDIPNRDLEVFQVRYWEPQNFPIFDDEGNVEFILHLVVDVTEEATFKLQLEASEQQYKELIHSLDVMVWQADPESNNCTYISPQAKNILGYDQEDWYEPGFWKEKLYPEDREWVISEINKHTSEGKNYQIEYRMIKSDGTEIWLSDRVSLIKENGIPVKIRGVLTDITQKKLAEKQLEVNERKFRKILDHSLDIIWTVDSDGKIRQPNAAVKKMLGYTPEELEGKSFIELVHEEDKALSLKEAEDLMGGKPTISFENRFLSKEGKCVPLLWSAHWDEKEERIFCVGKDITQKKEAEDQLKYSEQRFRGLVQHGGDFIAILDKKGINTYVSPTAKSITGWEMEHLVGYSAFTFIHEEDVDRVKANFQRTIEGENVLTETFRIQNKEGKYIWMETYAINMLDNPVINGVVINARDITEKKHYLEWHEYVNKATNNAIFDWDLEENQILWGGNSSLLFNSSEETSQLKFHDYVERFHPDDKDRMLKLLRNLIKDTSKNQLKSSCRVLNAQKIYLDVEIDGYFIRNRSGYVIRMIGAIRDVSIQKRFERELKISNQRYELVTQATSDVIWDWDLNTNSLFWGEGTEKLFGYTEGSLKPNIRSWYSRIHPKDYKKITGEIKSIIASDKNLWEGEYRFLRSDGEYNYVYDRGFLVRDNNGKALRLVGAMQNIHAEKMREVEDNLKLELGNIFTHVETIDSCLKETLKAIRKVHEYAYAELWLTNPHDNTISLRAHYGKGIYVISEDQTRFSKNEGLAGKIWSINEPKFIESLENDIDFARKNLAKDNEFIKIAGFPVPFYDKVKAVIIFFYKRKIQHINIPPVSKDIFNFLGSEIQRKKAEVQLDHFFELSPDLMCITDISGNFIKVNEAFESLLGFKKEDILQSHFLELIHPEDKHIFEDVEQKVLTGEIMFHESRMRKKSGDFLWLSWTGKPFSKDGLIVGVGKNISEKKLQEEALANSHQETLNILESIQDGFLAVNHDWSVSYWNNAAEKIVQTKRDDILGNNLWSVIPVDKEFKFYREFKKVMEEGVSVRFDEYYAPLDIWVMISAYPSETGLTAYLKDITESKIASLKLIQFKKVIENSKDEIAIISTVNESIYLNPAFIDSFGYGSEMLKQLGGPQKIFAHEDQAAQVFSDLLAGRHWKGDVDLIGNTKSLRSYYISAGPIYDDNGKLIAVFIIHTDISKRKETEGKLTSLYNNLQQQATELTGYREELDQLAQKISENFKEPLKRLSQKLRDFNTNYCDDIEEEGLSEINQALDSSVRMQLLISELLNYTLVGKENGNLTKVDLNEVIKEILHTLREDIHAKYAVIEVPNLPIVKGNKTHFIQIFKDLILNSLTYNQEKPEIKIRFSSAKTHWTFSVEDNGIGISSENHERIFKLFERIDGSKQEIGAGMGLAVIRKIIKQYKGKIWVESKVNKGSTFHFTISKDL